MIRQLLSHDLGEIRFSSFGRVEKRFQGHGSHSLKWVLKGEEIYLLDGREYRLTAGECFLFPKNMAYTGLSPNNRLNQGFCIDLNPIVFRALDGLVENGGKQVLFEPYKINALNPSLLKQMGTMAINGHESDEYFELCLTQLIELAAANSKEIQGQWKRVPAKSSVARQELFMRLSLARTYLHDCVSENPSLQEVASVVGVSPFHLQRLFTQVFGKSPRKYLETLKMERARQYIESGGMSVTETAQTLGFADPSYFTRRFKKYHLTSPKQLSLSH